MFRKLPIRFQFTSLPKPKPVDLHYLPYNNKKPLNLIILHGLLGSHKNFRFFCQNPLISSRTNCYLVDLRNHGNSPHTQQHTIEALASDLNSFLNKHKLKNVTLLGHSMGGSALIAFSKIYPEMQSVVDNMIIVDMANRMGKAGEPIRSLLTKLQTVNINQPLESVFGQIKSVINNPKIQGLVKTNIRQKNPNSCQWVANIKTLLSEYDKMMEFHVKDRTDWLRPVDVVYGGDSDFVDDLAVGEFRRLYRNFTEGSLWRVEGAGHWVHFQKPEEFVRVVDGIYRKYGK